MKSTGKQVKKSTPAPVPVLLRVPKPLLKQIDAASAREGRSRTKEVCRRLAESFKNGHGSMVGANGSSGK